MSYGITGGGFRGNLGADPEVNAGEEKAKLRVAIQMGKEQTEWVGLDITGKFLDFLASAKKGDTIIVTSCRVTTRDTQDGKKFVNVWASAQDVTVVPKGALKRGADDLPF